MTRKQAIREAKRLSKRSFGRELFVVYDINYEETYGKDQAWAICSAYDLDTFYATEIPVFSTED